jgi:energy-coupling factor transport system ATP-binding protein
MIKFENVSYSYPDGFRALSDINLFIKPGERIAVAGGNGSGKTTLALLINGILQAKSGSIEVGGLDPSDDDDNILLKRRVGLVFQNPDNQLVSTTVEREIAFSLENMNIPQPEMKERVGQMLELFQLESFRDRLNSDLSGGEKQRVALAAVMVAEPEVLILDEPGSYLDESGKRLLDEAIVRLLREKEYLTLIRITQYAEIAERYDRMLVFDKGRIIVDDRPSEIFSREDISGLLNIKIPFKYLINNRSLHIKKKPEEDSKGEPRIKGVNRVRLQSVSFGYNNNGDKQRLFDNLNLEITSDQVYGLVGASGSGKTTLIQLMAGLLKPQKGNIIYGGFEEKPGEVAVVFQQSERQFFLDTVDREIRFGAENLARYNVEAIVNNCYRLIGLDRETYCRRDPFTLSGGEKRRVAFGSVLSLEPMFLFFDEPTCALDFRGIELFKQMVARLKAEGVGVVIISHYGNIIFDLADEIIVLNNGAIESTITKNDFFREVKYQNYLSIPDLVSFQLERFGELRYYSESELIDNI